MEGNHALAQEPITRDILSTLTKRTKGVVFDSSPAWFSHIPLALRRALIYCTWQEKLDILVRFGPGVLLYDSDETVRLTTNRCQEYFDLLRTDPLDIPQLYLCSKDDIYSSFSHIEELARHRQAIQHSPVQIQVWDSSPHCAHLRAHPKDYTDSIELFTATCLLRSRL